MEIGRVLIMGGIFLLVAGLIFTFVPGLGKLPGDILIKRGNSSFYFPFVSSIILSIVLSILLNVFLRK